MKNIRIDWILHALVCANITSILFPLVGLWSMLIAMLVGLGKEIYDSRKGGSGFDMTDIFADFVGVFISVFVYSILKLIL